MGDGVSKTGQLFSTDTVTDHSSLQMSSEVVQYFRNELHAAREVILRDSEALEKITLVFENRQAALPRNGITSAPVFNLSK